MHTLPAGEDLKPVIVAMGVWGQRWVESESSLRNLDPQLLMWDMRRNLDTTPLPAGRSTIQFIYEELAQPRRNWWLIVEPGTQVDLCSVDPGFDVDLYVATDLRTMTEVWMGYKTAAGAKEDGKLVLTGSRQLEGALQSWLGLSPFAKEKKLVA